MELDEIDAFPRHKNACDEAVLTLLSARTLGNSPGALRNNLHELHSEDWLRRQLRYLSDCPEGTCWTAPGSPQLPSTSTVSTVSNGKVAVSCVCKRCVVTPASSPGTVNICVWQCAEGGQHKEGGEKVARSHCQHC
jgi:hypothetical protein